MPPTSHFNLAAALYEQGNIGEAMTHYRRVLEIRPDHAEAHTNLGIALAAQGDWGRAIAHYREALQAMPNSADTLNALGDALTMTGDLAQAITVGAAGAGAETGSRPSVGQPRLHQGAGLRLGGCRPGGGAGLDALVRQGARDVPPFVALMLPAPPADRLLAARQWSQGFATSVTRSIMRHGQRNGRSVWAICRRICAAMSSAG